jgi:ATP-dependent DNA ligase
MFAAVCDLGLEGIVSKKLNVPYRSGPSKKPESASSHA